MYIKLPCGVGGGGGGGGGEGEQSYMMCSVEGVHVQICIITKSYFCNSACPLDVPRWIETLIEEFDCLHERLVNELSKGGISIDQVLRALTRLPFTFRMEYESTIQNLLPELEKNN